MMQIPLTIGTLHFVGIGGIGMSGIAEILHNLGYQVTGSDMAESANIQRLRASGIKIFLNHHPDNLKAASVLVVSSAIQKDNPELIAAQARNIPIVPRAEMLAELMRLKWSIAVGGTHGKTTTTSLIAALLDMANKDPTVVNGGIINAYGTNARLGHGDWLVAEADESDGSFLKLPAMIAIVTNIDPEHLDYYGDFDTLKEAFKAFVQAIPFYGFACLCIDHPEVQNLMGQISDRRILTYGLSPQADIRATAIKSSAEGTEFDLILHRKQGGSSRISDIKLPMHGDHNVQNCLAAIAVAVEMGLDESSIRTAITQFRGVKRRYTQTGRVNDITIIDDYGHHPTEIAAVLKAARAATRRHVIAVFQPHRYSRVHDLFEEFCTCFNEADHVIVADIYAAGEAAIPGISRDDLVAGLNAHGHRSVSALDAPEDLPDQIMAMAKPGDLVICLGAGTITQWANQLPSQFQARLEEQDQNRSQKGQAHD